MDVFSFNKKKYGIGCETQTAVVDEVLQCKARFR